MFFFIFKAMASKIKTVLADSCVLFRQALSEQLAGTGKLKISFEASNEKQLFQLLKKSQPQLILMSATFGSNDGTACITEIKRLYPDIKILVTAMDEDEMLIFSMVKHGANGFIMKHQHLDDALIAMHSVLEKGFYYTEEVTRAMLNGVTNRQRQRNSQNTSELTERETEIIGLICQQYTIKDIAAHLKLSPRTVESHKENILMKTGSKNLAGIVLYAVEHRLI